MKKIRLVVMSNSATLAELLEITDRCPVHRILENDPQIVTELVVG